MSTTVGMREVRLGWWGSCRECATLLSPDSRAFQDPVTHTLTCLACAYADLPPYTTGTDGSVINAPTATPSSAPRR